MLKKPRNLSSNFYVLWRFIFTNVITKNVILCILSTHFFCAVMWTCQFYCLCSHVLWRPFAHKQDTTCLQAWQRLICVCVPVCVSSAGVNAVRLWNNLWFREEVTHTHMHKHTHWISALEGALDLDLWHFFLIVNVSILLWKLFKHWCGVVNITSSVSAWVVTSQSVVLCLRLKQCHGCLLLMINGDRIYIIIRIHFIYVSISHII